MNRLKRSKMKVETIQINLNRFTHKSESSLDTIETNLNRFNGDKIKKFMKRFTPSQRLLVTIKICVNRFKGVEREFYMQKWHARHKEHMRHNETWFT